MQAQGEHLLVRLPSKKAASESGILLPDNFGQIYAYGRVVSMGAKVLDRIGVPSPENPYPNEKHGVHEGGIICFDSMGRREVELDPLKDSDLVMIHASQVYFTMVEAQLEKRKLPIPA